MNTKNPQRAQILLQQLFSGESTLQERALLAVAPHERERVRKLVKVRQDAELLFQVMLADLGSASGRLRKEFKDQFWRRSAVRALAATVDGTIYSLKQLAMASAGLLGRQLNPEEEEFLLEKKVSSASGKVRLPGFRENCKQTFKLFAKAYGTSCSTDFGQKGFEALCETFALRHRVTHPKSFMTFCVQDDETKRAGVAIDWLSCELQRLLTTSHCALGTNPETSS